MTDALIPLLGSSVRLSVPLLLACLAGLYSERSGVIDIGLEGKMLAGAFAAASVALLTGSAWLGLLAAIGVATAMSIVHGFASISLGGNQIVSGVAINFFAAGLTVVLGESWFHEGGRTPIVPDTARFEPVDLAGADLLRDVPIIGRVYADIVSGHNLLVYLAFALVPVTYLILRKTLFGLRLRAVGENPKAVDTAGVSVAALRYSAVAIAGVLCGVAGAYISTAQVASFSPQMTAGKGFIALAALIFARWRPWRALAACLLFGFLEALQIHLQGAALPWIGQVPVQAIQALPYLLTVILLAGLAGEARAPKASGVPFTRER